MHLYHLPVSLYSFKVRLATALKELDIELREPPGGTYRSEEYRRLVATGTIPALVDGDLVLPESDAIIEYLDERWPARSLLPGDARQRARARLASRLHDFHLEPRVRALFPLVPNGRDAGAVAAAGRAIAEKLAVVEAFLDAAGPFAAGDAPTIGDCGLAATTVWLAALAPVLETLPSAGPRLARVTAALDAHAVAGPQRAAYRKLVDAWVAGRLAS